MSQNTRVTAFIISELLREKKKRYFGSQFEFFILAYSDKLNPAAIFRSETYQFWGKAVT